MGAAAERGECEVVLGVGCRHCGWYGEGMEAEVVGDAEEGKEECGVGEDVVVEVEGCLRLG